MSFETEDQPFSNEETDLYDDGSNREIMNGIVLKKGPWTSTEDAILIEYVNKHGEGNWNAVQKDSGLFRCGKSCRLRWANHLRPDLKKGPFTAEEESLIIELHAKIGNKWARMAAHLPGRTDNEIKNYWNTRIKRCHRAGLSLYSQKASLLLDSSSDDLLMMNSRPNGYSNTRSHGSPDVILHNLSASHDMFPYFPELLGESLNGMLFEAIGSSGQSNHASLHQPKRHCGSRDLECELDAVVKNELFPLEAAQNDPLVKSTGFIFPYDCDPIDHNWPLGVIQDSHSFEHGNFSTPMPACQAEKSELPSFQYPDTDSSNWDTSYSASPLHGPNETVHSENSSPRNSGLLDALLYEARKFSGVKNQSSKKSSNSSALTSNDFADDIGHKFCKAEIQISSEPVSPLNSATSIYSGSAFTASRGTIKDGHSFVEAYSEQKVKREPIDSVNNPFEENIAAMFDSESGMPSYTNWLDQESCFTTNQTTMEEALAEALGSSNKLAAVSRYKGSDYIWNNMHSVRQMSNIP